MNNEGVNVLYSSKVFVNTAQHFRRNTISTLSMI